MNEEKIMNEEKFEVGGRYLVKDARHPIMSPINEVIVQELTDKYIKVQHKLNNVIGWYEISDFIVLEKLSNETTLIRNCDVGTFKEQALRFKDFCYEHKQYDLNNICKNCPLDKSEVKCEFAWQQMEYKKR